MLAQAEHGSGSLVAAVSPSAAHLDAPGVRAASAASWSSRRSATPPSPSWRWPAPAEAIALANAFAAEHLELIGEDVEALAGARQRCGLPVRRRGERDRVRRLRRRLQPHPPDAGAARFASGLTPRHFRRRMTELRVGAAAAKLAAAGAPIARAEGFEVHAARWSRRADSWRIQRHDENRDASSARRARPTCGCGSSLEGTGEGARSTGVGFLDHMLDLLARHGRLDLDVEVNGDLETGAHHTAEDTAIVLGQALDSALGDRTGIVRYGVCDRADGRGARELRDRHLGPPAHGVRGRAAARGRPAASSTS